mmetsp:Transcript_6645/g.14400  ORF Transcript_6645/g.14400 Transcript_6645/m.14400 type:complete len:354 (-) Transcript_6645:42-1103(-)
MSISSPCSLVDKSFKTSTALSSGISAIDVISGPGTSSLYKPNMSPSAFIRSVGISSTPRVCLNSSSSLSFGGSAFESSSLGRSSSSLVRMDSRKSSMDLESVSPPSSFRRKKLYISRLDSPKSYSSAADTDFDASPEAEKFVFFSVVNSSLPCMRGIRIRSRFAVRTLSALRSSSWFSSFKSRVVVNSLSTLCLAGPTSWMNRRRSSGISVFSAPEEGAARGAAGAPAAAAAATSLAEGSPGGGCRCFCCCACFRYISWPLSRRSWAAIPSPRRKLPGLSGAGGGVCAAPGAPLLGIGGRFRDGAAFFATASADFRNPFDALWPILLCLSFVSWIDINGNKPRADFCLIETPV